MAPYYFITTQTEVSIQEREITLVVEELGQGDHLLQLDDLRVPIRIEGKYVRVLVHQSQGSLPDVSIQEEIAQYLSDLRNAGVREIVLEPMQVVLTLHGARRVNRTLGWYEQRPTMLD